MHRSMRLSFSLLAISAATILVSAQVPGSSLVPSRSSTAPDLVLQGNVHGSQNHTYVKAPFRVPAGVQRVTITFSYTGREQHTALDLGLLDPTQLRCWSGGNKSLLTVALSDATPSCLPGSLPSGIWNVLIGVPNIRPHVTVHYTANVYFTRTGLVADEPANLRAPLRTGSAWYRGDLHMHTGHSDGQCPSQTGHMVPCPVFFTVDAAARRGLDFIAITDHNATSQYDAMRELQPYFDKLLLIPGREITTFHGHLNLLGTTQFLDFRLGSSSVPNINALLRNVHALGALISINHPRAPTGEICMGCGWDPNPPAQMNLVDAVEAVNGGSDDSVYSGVPFWQQQLDLGHRLTAIGGSDNHRPLWPLDHPGSIGRPTTVVYADELSTPAILAAIRAGHVFIDLTGSSNRILNFTATAGTSVAHMGDQLTAPLGARLQLAARVTDVPQGRVVILADGQSLQTGSLSASTVPLQTVTASWTSDGRRHWFRADVYGPDQKLWLLGNPVYVNWDSAD